MSDRPANEERGELTLVLDGESLVLRPSYEAIAAFESLTGKGLFDLATEAVDHKLRLTETALIAAECIKAWGRATGNKSMQGVNAVRIAELILESDDGYKGALETVAGMLAMATTGGYTASGEVKAATVKTTSSTSAESAAA